MIEHQKLEIGKLGDKNAEIIRECKVLQERIETLEVLVRMVMF